MSATPPQADLPPPMLGQHTEEVLSDLLGRTPEQIAGMREKGII
jgi:formyl-CoA transferase